MKNIAPNFLIVGTAKAGTTSLFNYLNQHSDIYIPPRKECRFFSNMPGTSIGPGSAYQNDVIKNYDDYLKHFNDCNSKSLRGDISNDYLFFAEESSKNILHFLGVETKILIILRSPIHRAYSNFLHHAREGWETITFLEALNVEAKRKKENWAWPYLYKETGHYEEQIPFYKDKFLNIKILIIEEFPTFEDLLSEVLNFLDAPNEIKLSTEKRYNQSGYQRTKWIHNILHSKGWHKKIAKVLLPDSARRKLREKAKQLNTVKKPMDEQSYEILKAYFAPRIQTLENTLNKDLSIWR